VQVAYWINGDRLLGDMQQTGLTPIKALPELDRSLREVKVQLRTL